MIRTIAVIASVAAATLSIGAPAEAAHRPGRTRLVLSYMADAGYAVAVKLRCDPPGGGHREAAKACRTLRRADGQPGDIKAAHTMCMMIYAPVSAEVTGVWRGHPIAWQQTFGNKCELNRATGVLFAF